MRMERGIRKKTDRSIGGKWTLIYLFIYNPYTNLSPSPSCQNGQSTETLDLFQLIWVSSTWLAAGSGNSTPAGTDVAHISFS